MWRFFGQSRRLAKVFIRLRESVPALDGVQAAFVYGPWAARAKGSWRARPGDTVDLLVVGPVDERELERMCREASAELGVEVKATVVSGEEWRGDSSGLVRSVKAGPLLAIV
ncbi:MAG TPA: hypothetical protein VFR32_04525 [Gaiellaceae bacterium]|nr:hypothetical protein [Gaiellaceae bacterium]